MDSSGAARYRKEQTQVDPSIQLDRDRRRNNERLKGTFEHIFAKYTKDFSNVGDEIDLETGRIVVNNGHIARMQHERDVGASTSKRLARALTEDVGDRPSQDDIRGLAYDDSDEDELSPARGSLRASHSYRTTGSTTGSGEEDGNTADLDDSEYDRRHDDASSTPEDEPDDANATATAMTQGILSGVPAIRESLGNPASQGQTFSIDPAAINALGQSIANQIAQFLHTHVKPVLQPKAPGAWSVPPLPQDLRHPTPRRITSPTPLGLQSPMAGHSLWALTQRDDNPRPPKRRMTKESRHHNRSVGSARMLGLGLGDTNSEAVLDSVESSTYDSDWQAPAAIPQIDDETEDEGADPVDPSASRFFLRFSQDEDERIHRMRSQKMPWKQISAHFPGRSTPSLQKRYFRVLRDMRIPQHPHMNREIIEIEDEDDVHNGAGNAQRSWNHNIYPSPNGRQPAFDPWTQGPGGGNAHHNQPHPSFFRDVEHWAAKGSHTHATWPAPNPYSPPPDINHETSSRPQPQPWVMALPGQERPRPYGNVTQPVNPSYEGLPFPTPWQDGTELTNPPGRRKVKNGKRRRHDGEYPRYRTFDTTQGEGTFGVLRTQQPLQLIHYAAQPLQEKRLGPRTEKTGAFGMLKTSQKPDRSWLKLGPATVPAPDIPLDPALTGGNSSHPIEIAHEDAPGGLLVSDSDTPPPANGIEQEPHSATLPQGTVKLIREHQTHTFDKNTENIEHNEISNSADGDEVLPQFEGSIEPQNDHMAAERDFSRSPRTFMYPPPPDPQTPTKRPALPFIVSSPLPTPSSDTPRHALEKIDNSPGRTNMTKHKAPRQTGSLSTARTFVESTKLKKPIINRQVVTPTTSRSESVLSSDKRADPSSLRASTMRKSVKSVIPPRLASPAVSRRLIRTKPIPLDADKSDDELA